MNIEENLEKFLDNPKLNIDNNPAERAIRGIAIMRKNCLFAVKKYSPQRVDHSYLALNRAFGLDGRQAAIFA